MTKIQEEHDNRIPIFAVVLLAAVTATALFLHNESLSGVSDMNTVSV